MFRTIFYKEIRENITSNRFLTVFIICLIIIPLGVYVSTRDFQTRQQSYQESINLYGESHKSPADLLYRGAKAYRPPSGLSFLSLGLEIVMPNVAETQNKTGESQSFVELKFNNNQSPDNIYEFFHGPLDLVFIVAVMMTFFAIAFSYGSISGEKEQGTLKQILCNAVPRNQIILAKMAANYLTLVTPFLITVILSLVIFQGNGLALFGSDRAWFFVTLSVVFSLLLIGAFFNLGLLVSTLTRQAVSTIVILLLGWVLLYGIFPRLSSIFAQLVYPVKSQQVLVSEKNQVRLENEMEFEAKIDKLLETGQSSLDKQKSIREELSEKLKASLQKLDREWEKRRDVQRSLAINLARFSPVSCFIRPMAEISKTGWLEWQAFVNDVSRFQQALNDKVFSKNLVEVMKGGKELHEGKLSGPAPIFHLQPVLRESLVNNVLPDFILLVVYNLLFFAGAYVKFLNYDAR